MKTIFCTLGLIFLSLYSFAGDGEFLCKNHIYKNSIHTVKLERTGELLSDAILYLNSGDQLSLSFDDLSPEPANYSYKYVHCDFNWKPSSLHQSDYTDGFFFESVGDFRPSYNTYCPYYHYSSVFPTDQMRITRSGNYILYVFDTADPEQPVITRRFRVDEQMVQINPQVHRATLAEARFSGQEVDFNVDFTGSGISNAFADLKVAIMQNGRNDNMITGLKPLYIQGEIANYNYEDGNVFNGGNEFRNFDLRSLKYATPFVAAITNDPGTNFYHVKLRRDQSRSSERYSTDDDINGRYLVKIYDGRNDDTEADYATVNFTLLHDKMENGTFYILGGLTGWELEEKNKMSFNPQTQSYQASLFLKQGYYNYQYVFADEKNTADETIIEGNHYETENDYSIFVYYSDPLKRFDRLIGYKKSNSRP